MIVLGCFYFMHEQRIELVLTNITTIDNHNNLILVKLCYTTTKVDRTFVVSDEFLNMVRKYEALCPVSTNTDQF